MSSLRITRAAALLAGATAVAATLAACGTTTEKPAESSRPSSPSPSISTPPTPTEKNVTPGGMNPGAPNNSFTPSVTARPAPTALPGNVITGG